MKRKRIGVLTAGGDTPALNATIYGIVEEANRRDTEVLGLIRGYASLLGDKVPTVLLNPLFSTIPEIDPCVGGTILGSSRTYVDPESTELHTVRRNLERLQLDGLICIGGDGTINAMQALAEITPCVLAPKTIDNDLGLNYAGEPNDWTRPEAAADAVLQNSRGRIGLDDIVNYATPGFATAVFVVVQSIDRIRTTAESHRRVAVVEVMGRQSGYIALGAAYAQPDFILIPEVALNLDDLEYRVRHLYEIQHHVVIVVGEGVRMADGSELGATEKTYDPAGNIRYSGAGDALADLLQGRIQDGLFERIRTGEPTGSAFFTRKIGHTQRGGRPIQFDRYYGAQIGGKAMQLIADGNNNQAATLQYSGTSGFEVSSLTANRLRDPWGEIHARRVHPSLYDAERMQLSQFGREYLQPIFTDAIGWDDVEFMRAETFSPGNLTNCFQSVNVDIRKRIRLS